jgi:L-ribulose-5-phosphate 4-epimerase
LDESAFWTEEKLRRDLARYSKWLGRLGFTPGTSGNLSVRLDRHRLLVTPTGMSKSSLKAADMVIVDMNGSLLAGTRKVTSEVSMHLAVYHYRADVTAVVHSHPPIATAFACSGKALDEMLCQEAVMTLGVVPLAEYATTGTDEVAASLWQRSGLVFDAALGEDAFLVGVFDFAHFGYGVGDFYQLWVGVAAGEDDVDHFGAFEQRSWLLTPGSNMP